MPSWVKCKYFELSVEEGSGFRLTHLSSEYLCPDDYTIRKTKWPETFQCEKQIWFQFPQDPLYMQNRWTVLNTLYREIFIRDLMVYARDPRRKTSQRQLFYLRDSPQIFLWNMKKGRAPAFYCFAAYSFLLCSQGPWEVQCRWIDLNSCFSRIPRVLPQHRAFSTGTSDTGGPVVSDWGACLSHSQTFHRAPPLSPLSDSSTLCQVVTIKSDSRQYQISAKAQEGRDLN